MIRISSNPLKLFRSRPADPRVVSGAAGRDHELQPHFRHVRKATGSAKERERERERESERQKERSPCRKNPEARGIQPESKLRNLSFNHIFVMFEKLQVARARSRDPERDPERERERAREIEREREREREMYRARDRDTNRQTEAEAETETETDRDRGGEREREKKKKPRDRERDHLAARTLNHAPYTRNQTPETLVAEIYYFEKAAGQPETPNPKSRIFSNLKP